MSTPEHTSDTEESSCDEEAEPPTFLVTPSMTAWLKENNLLTAISRLEEEGISCLSDVIIHFNGRIVGIPNKQNVFIAAPLSKASQKNRCRRGVRIAA